MYSFVINFRNMVLVPANMPRFGFSPCKKNCRKKSLQIFLFSKLVSDPTFVMICICDTWWLYLFCRKKLLQNILFFKIVHTTGTNKQESGSKDYFKKKKKKFRDFFLQFFLQELKSKRDIFTGTKTIF